MRRRLRGQATLHAVTSKEAPIRRLLVAVALVITAAVAVLVVGARGSDEAPADGGAEQTAQATESASTTEAVTSTNAWVTEEEMRTSQERSDEDGSWVVGFFFRPGSECAKRGSEDLIRRFRLISEEGHGLSRERLIGKAFAALEGAHPAGLSNPLEAVRLELLGARVEADAVYLDLGRGIYATNSTGTCGGSAMAAQFVALVQYYFPDTSDLCVLVDGIPSGREGEALLFHDSAACPIPLQN